MSRIVASPLLVYAIANDMKEAALGGCLLAGFSDWLDGYIAKNYNQMTTLGGYLDPIADKIMIGAVTIGLTLKGLLPFELATVIIGRDVVILTVALTYRAIKRPKGSAFFDVRT